MDTPTKLCTKCKEVKPIADFHVSRNRPLSRCKQCHNAASAEYRRTHPERRSQTTKRYYQRNRDKILQSQKEYRYGPNRARRLAAQRKYEHSNKEKVNAIKAAYERNHLERRKRYRKAYYQSNKKRYYIYRRNRMARIIQAEGTFDERDIQSMMNDQKGRCYYCKCNLNETGHHVDHIVPLSRGGSNERSNLVLACPDCNLKKGARMPHEWPDGGRLL